MSKIPIEMDDSPEDDVMQTQVRAALPILLRCLEEFASRHQLYLEVEHGWGDKPPVLVECAVYTIKRGWFFKNPGVPIFQLRIGTRAHLLVPEETQSRSFESSALSITSASVPQPYAQLPPLAEVEAWFRAELEDGLAAWKRP